MLDSDGRSWSNDRIRQEIQNRRDYIHTLDEAIEHHLREYERLTSEQVALFVPRRI
jgi:flagellar biosynthesis chaperone FliJ